MNCKTCNIDYPPNQLWLGQCIQCVGKERDEAFDTLETFYIDWGEPNDFINLNKWQTELINLRYRASKRTHP